MQVIPVTQKDGVQRLCARVRGILDNFCPMDECLQDFPTHSSAQEGKEDLPCELGCGKYMFASSASWLWQKQFQPYPQVAKAFLTFREMHNNRSLSVGLGNARSRRTIKRTWEFW